MSEKLLILMCLVQLLTLASVAILICIVIEGANTNPCTSTCDDDECERVRLTGEGIGEVATKDGQ